MTLALPKIGLFRAPTDTTGTLYLADIIVPPHLYQVLDIEIGPIFSDSRILRVVQ